MYTIKTLMNFFFLFTNPCSLCFRLFLTLVVFFFSLVHPSSLQFTV